MKNQRMAEGVGFEPTVGFPTLDFESSALNRTQPPFREAGRKRPTPNVQHPTLNANGPLNWTLSVQRWAFDRLYSARRLACPESSGREDSLSHEAKKCYNFRLATSANLTASCMSTRTATLLLVVDRYSQVLGAAVHQYSQLIRTSTPLLPP